MEADELVSCVASYGLLGQRNNKYESVILYKFQNSW